MLYLITSLKTIFVHLIKYIKIVSYDYLILYIKFQNCQFFKNYISSFAKIDNVLISSSNILIYGANTSGNKEHFLAYINIFHIMETDSNFFIFLLYKLNLILSSYSESNTFARLKHLCYSKNYSLTVSIEKNWKFIKKVLIFYLTKNILYYILVNSNYC